MRSDYPYGGDRPVLAGLVELYFRTTQRMIVLHMASEPDRIFHLALSARPRLSEEHGLWMRVDFIAQTSSRPAAQGGSWNHGDDFGFATGVPDPQQTAAADREFEIRLPEGYPAPR